MKVSFNSYSTVPVFKSGNRDSYGIPSFCGAKNNTDLTPTELYEKFRAGERPRYITDTSKDENLERLSLLTERYKKTPTLRNKSILLNHERKMLYEELKHPELTLARNYKDISAVIPKTTPSEEVGEIITNFNLIGLSRIELLSKPFQTKYSNKKIKLLDKIYNSANEDKEFGSEIRFNAATAMSGLEEAKKYKTPEMSAEDISNLIEYYKEEKDPDTLKIILTFAHKENKKQVTNLVENILTLKNTDYDTKLLAVWGSGKFRSDKNFEVAKSIALNPNESIRLREFAIHSTSLYIKDKPKEVIETLNKISNDGTVFEPLGKILKDKVTGNYHNTVNREYETLSPSEIKEFEKFKKTHLYYDKKLNRRKLNTIDKDLLLFKNDILSDSERFNPIAIIKDTYTRIYKDEAGTRNFTQGLKNNGCFVDSVDGLHTNKIIILKNDLIGDKTNYSSVAHEMGHEINDYLSDSELKTLDKLYNKALKENRILLNYAGRNIEEYFAVGCDSIVSVYKPHSYLLSYCGKTRYSLMEKDPELYKFLKSILNVR